jgi:hypothetical protein
MAAEILCGDEQRCRAFAMPASRTVHNFLLLFSILSLLFPYGQKGGSHPKAASLSHME